jgi:molybdopterin-binding protein
MVTYEEQQRSDFVFVGVVQDIVNVYVHAAEDIEGAAGSTIVSFIAKVSVEQVIQGEIDNDYVFVEAEYEIEGPLQVEPYDYLVSKKYGKLVMVHMPPIRRLY